ncbi:MAG: hypothetical protein DRO62_01255 [Candidatus Altiarchaeales archaeon]|nr:MAG: hypothetical protein DRO62_01255 [Candidatus Altiarchaeales archaeon]
MALIPLDEKIPEGAKGGVVTGRKKKRTVIPRWQSAIFIPIFIVLISLLLLFPGTTLHVYGISVRIGTLVLLFILVLFALILPKALVKLLEYERAVVFRFGKFNRIAGPGWVIIFPIVEEYVRVDLRLQIYTIDPQEVVTRDKVRFLVSPEIFMYVSDPKDAVINVEDYKGAVLRYVNSALTHICGNSPSDYIVSHMDEISHRLEDSIHHIANRPERRWGVIIPRIKLTLVRFPDKVQNAMHEKVASEQLKLAAHEKAEATKIEIDAIREAGAKLTDPAITYMYLEALDKVARGRATKIVLPLEISKIAETIARRTGASVGEIPQIQIPPGLIEQYKETIDNYEDRIKSIESRLNMAEKKHKETEKIENYERGVELPEKKKTFDEEEKEKYKRRIKKIKERLGIE